MTKRGKNDIKVKEGKMLIFVISWLVLISNIFPLAAEEEYELVLKITPPSPFEHPYGLGISPDQRLYVTDSGNDRVCVFSTSGEFLFAFGQGELSEPSDVAFDQEGNVYVSSCDEGRVKKFTANGEYLNESLEGLSQPEGVCIDSQGNIYVVNKGSNQIKKFNSQHELVATWGGPGNGPGEFNTPYGIAVDAQDYIYVADCNNDRIQKFDSEGNYITEWGGAPYPFDGPEDIAFDSEGNFYVAEVETERIQKFTSNGEFITKWGLDEFQNLGCVALDQEDNVYATCYYGDCVYKFALRPPVVNIEATDGSAAEAGLDSGTFTLSQTGTVDALVVNYTIAGSAENGIDYAPIVASVTIPAGSNSATITIIPIDDELVEGSENVVLTLVASDDYEVGPNNTAEVVIVSDDVPVVNIEATDGSAAEAGLDSGTFTLSQTGTVDALVVNYTIAGSAENGVDYAPIAASVTIPAGSNSAIITITPIDDELVEGSENVVLTLVESSGYEIGSGNNATVTIADNDADDSVLVEKWREMPGEVKLGLSYPNPFNPESWLPFGMSVEGKVVVRIYNVLGQLVREMDLGVKGAGWHWVSSRAIYWDGRDSSSQSVPGGIYFCQLIVGEKVITKQMVILK
jgi:sugar lactone lactonase YvrE